MKSFLSLPMRHRLLRWLLSFVALLMLGGCDMLEFYPTGATEIITVEQGGKVKVSYTGSFHDIYDVMSVFMGQVGGPVPTSDEVGKDFSKDLDDIGARYQYGQNGAVQITRMDFTDQDLPPVMAWLGKVSQDGETAVKISGDDSVIGMTSGNVNTVLDVLSDSSSKEADPEHKSAARALMKLISEKVAPRFKGTLIVRTRQSVHESNADEIRTAADGYKEYVWHMGYPPRAPHMVIDTGA